MRFINVFLIVCKQKKLFLKNLTVSQILSLSLKWVPNQEKLRLVVKSLFWY